MIYISPPFGARVPLPGALRVLGSYTALPRPGRMGQVLRTVRPVPGGWVNAIGLRNPGVWSVLPFRENRVCSLTAIEPGDWERLLDHVQAYRGALPRRIELNVSCPNVPGHVPLSTATARAFVALSGAVVSVKLAALPGAIEDAQRLTAEAGIRLVHLSNTLPSPAGGISGRPLFDTNLPLIERAARQLGDGVEIIAGGGIYSPTQARAYLDAGARHLSLATVFFNPMRAARLVYWFRREGLFA